MKLRWARTATDYRFYSNLAAFETQRYFGIIMEYIPGGELFDYVQKQEGMNELNGREMFRGILEGVQHCHKHGIAHRDLKLENILLTKENKPKIADFGFSKNVSSVPLHSSMVGSLLYSSPEIIQGKPYQGPECDIWSLGVILYTMLTATMPFDDSNMGEFLNKIESGVYPSPLRVSDGKLVMTHAHAHTQSLKHKSATSQNA